MTRFKHKPTMVDAVQFDGKNHELIIEWAHRFNSENSQVVLEYQKNEDESLDPIALVIETPEGDLYASPGDWIVRGVVGEFYPVKPDVFENVYDQVET